MGRCASCGIEGHRRLRAPCIAQGRRCNDCSSEGHLARVCTTKKNLYTERNRGHAKQKGKMPASRACLTRGAGVHAQETSKRQKTRSLESFDNNDNQTAGERILFDGNDMTTRGATSHQESASRDRNTGGYAVGNVVSHQSRVKETRRSGREVMTAPRYAITTLDPPSTNCSQPAGRIPSESRSYRE
jgi:hypothetical protein